MTDIKERLLSWCIDWNGAPMVDGEQPRIIPRVRDLRDAADEIGRLRRVPREADASMLICVVDAAIEAIERNSTSAPVLECLKAGRDQFLGARAALSSDKSDSQ